MGTNIGITRMIGNLLQDEKVPGVHIAFGNPYGSQTGATWTCPTHIDAITRHCDVWAGSEQIMAERALPGLSCLGSVGQTPPTCLVRAYWYRPVAEGGSAVPSTQDPLLGTAGSRML